MFRPFHFIATFAIKTIVGYFNLPTNLVSLFKILYTTSIMLTGTVGFIPTIRGLIFLRTLITGGSATNLFTNTISLSSRLNPFVVDSLTRSIINIYSPKIIKDNLKIFSKVYSFFMFILGFSMFKPLTFWLVRFSFGVIVSSLGILWNESLYAITTLKIIATLM